MLLAEIGKGFARALQAAERGEIWAIGFLCVSGLSLFLIIVQAFLSIRRRK